MKLILAIFFVTLLFSCNRSNKEFKEYLSAADSIAINYFKGDGSMDTVIAVKIVKEKKTVEQFASFISAAEEDGNKQCGYDGSLHFFKNNMVMQDIDFRMNDVQCMIFSAKYQGKFLQTTLSPEARQLLETVKK